jgi:hypothetical protein
MTESKLDMAEDFLLFDPFVEIGTFACPEMTVHYKAGEQLKHFYKGEEEAMERFIAENPEWTKRD